MVLGSLELYDPGPLSATLDYVREVTGHESLTVQKPNNGVDAPHGPAGFSLLATPIRAVITQFGFPLCEVLLRRTLSDLPGDLTSSAMIILRLMSEHFPNDLSQWIPAIVEQLSPKLASLKDKTTFMEAFRK